MKLEQLEMIGYKPLLIHWHRWHTLTPEEKEIFIENEVEKVLKTETSSAARRIN